MKWVVQGWWLEAQDNEVAAETPSWSISLFCFFATSHISEVHVWGCDHLFSREKKKQLAIQKAYLQIVQNMVIALNTYLVGFTESITTII